MTYLLTCTIQTLVIFSLALLFCSLLRNSSAALRHRILTVAIVLALISPVLRLVLPPLNVNAGIRTSRAGVDPEQLSAAPSIPSGTQGSVSMPQPEASVRQRLPRQSAIPHWPVWLIWGIGVSVGLFSMLTGFFRMVRVASASQVIHERLWTTLAANISSEYGIRRPIRIMQSPNSSILVTWGWLHPAIIIPAGATEWEAGRASVVLRHELAHVSRGDWIVQVAGQLLRCICWFNPLVWVVCKRLRLESEYACDNVVLSSGVEGPDYADHLLDLAQNMNTRTEAWSAALAMARASTIERRFTAMLNSNINRRPVSLRVVLGIVLVGLCIALPLAALSSTELAQQSLTPRQIVARMATVYASASSYRDEGKIVSANALDRSFATVFERPTRFRFEFNRPEYTPKGQRRELRIAIWRSSPGQSQNWWSITGVPPAATMGMSIAYATGVSHGASHTIPRLLMGEEVGGFTLANDSWLDSTPPREESINGRACYRISGGYANSDKITLWIDKESFLIRRLDSLGDTTTYSPQLNVRIDPAVFQFQPPLVNPAQ